MTSIATLEAEFYRTVNRLIEPTVRSGCAFPSMALTGLIVLETRGRRTGLPHRTPVLATLIGDQVLVGTTRASRSDWVRNIRSNPDVRYWLRGRALAARALVFTRNDSAPDTQGLPDDMRRLVTTLLSVLRGLDVAFAFLIPQH